MIECLCDCDYEGDYYGIVGDYNIDTDGSYHACPECGDTIWPWEEHRVNVWWNCESCDDFDEDAGCEDAGCYEECVRGNPPDSERHTCKTCASAGDQLLCGCYHTGHMWEEIGDRNEMTVAECLGESREEDEG
jgi:hypothetical protein